MDRRLFLLLGIMLLLMVIASMLTGESFEGRYGFVYRAEEPKRFWWNSVFYVVVGVFLIGLYFYQN